MRISIIFFLVLLASLYQCNRNSCDLSEDSVYSRGIETKDDGFDKYLFQFEFKQKVLVYYGDCPDNKNVNQTTLKMTSLAPCDQTVTFTIDVNLGEDSYEVKKSNVAIKSNETLDFGVVKNGGARVDYAEITIDLFCPLCPGDEEL